jgi:hypothetical protein
MPLVPIIVAIVLAISSATGVAMVAETTVPGDLLYPVKVSVNEAVRDVITVSDVASANWEIRKAERRLEEAEELALRGDKDPLARVEANFERYLAKVTEIQEKLKNNDRVVEVLDVNSRLDSALSAHERTMDRIRLSSSDEEEQNNLTEAIQKVQDKVEKIRRDGIEFETALKASNVEEATMGKLEALNNQLEATEKLYDRKKEELTPDVTSSIDRHFQMVKTKIEEGIEEEGAEQYRKAFRIYQEATRLLQEVHTLIKVDRRLDLSEKIRERTAHRDEVGRQQREQRLSNMEKENEDSDNGEVEFENGGIEFQEVR